MKKILILSFLFSAFTVQAAGDAFSQCEKMTTDNALLQCQLGVIDRAIKTKFGQTALTRATKEAKKNCTSVGGSFRIHPSLRLLGSMQCQLDFKIEFYNKLLN